MTAIISPEGAHVVPPLTDGEGMLIADLDLGLITKRKRMMDSVGHYARPELLSARARQSPGAPLASAGCARAGSRIAAGRPGSAHMKPMLPTPLPTERLINELQSYGVRLVDPKAGHESRRGGAGPSDHKAITIDGVTVMVPVHTAPAFESPYVVEKPDALGSSRITRDGLNLGAVSFPTRAAIL